MTDFSTLLFLAFNYHNLKKSISLKSKKAGNIISYLKIDRMKILAVDDETDVQTLFEQRLRKEIKGGEVEFAFATSGNEAMNYLTSHPHDYILILSDINMPGMSGLELLKKIKQNFINPSPVVIMVSAYGDAYTYHQAMKFGADDFLTKPVDFNLLKEKIKSIDRLSTTSV